MAGSRPFRFSALALLTMALMAAPLLAAEGTLTEKSTGVAFPILRQHPTEGADLELSGVGLRKKAMVFKVYAFGLYVDPAAARDGLAAWKGKNADALAADPSFYSALVDLQGDRLCVMRFVRDVDAEAMQEALLDSLNLAVAATDPVRKEFAALWTEPLAEGSEAAILVRPDGKVVVLRDGREIGSVNSAEVGRALLLSWLGPKTISEDIRTGAAQRIPSILGAE